MGQLFQQEYTDMAYPGNLTTNLPNKTLTTASKLGAIFRRRTSDDFGASHYGVQTIKMDLNHFERL